MYLYLAFIVELIILYFLSRKVTRKLGTFFFKITKSEKWTVYIMAVLFLPGTFVHEMAHFLSALLLLVPVRQIELLPKVEEGKVSLGRVPIAKVDPIRRTLVGFAPLFVGIGLIFGSFYYVVSNDLLTQPLFIALLAYIVFEVGNTMYLSRRDIEGTWIFFVLLFLILTVLYLIGFRFNLNESILVSERVLEIVKRTNIFLLIPIVIDLLLLFVFNLFARYTK